jgi:hypothetical protein
VEGVYGDLSVGLLQILETGLQVELARPWDDVLAGFLYQGLHHRVHQVPDFCEEKSNKRFL